MDKKTVSFTLFLIISVLYFQDVLFARDCPGYALGCGAAKTYKVTMNRMEVSTSGNESAAVTIVSVPSQFDIASFNAGAIVGSWFSGAALGPGTYNWMRRRVSRTFYGKGYVTYGGSDYYTSNNPDIVTYGSGTNVRAEAAGTHTFIGSDAPSDYAEIAFTVSSPPEGFSLPTGMSMTADEIIQEDTSNTVIIGFGLTTRMRISFNVENTLQLVNQAGPVRLLQLGEPDASVAIVYE